MSVLSASEIKAKMAAGDIKVEPAPAEDAFGVASLDLTLHNEFRLFQARPAVRDVVESLDFNDVTEPVTLADGEKLLLLPNTACLAITREKITLSTKVCGLLEGRSRFARVGLAVHVTAGYIQPGVSNRTVLEIFNAGTVPLNLVPGVRICQMIFLGVSGDALPYSGRFKVQTSLAAAEKDEQEAE